MQVFDFIRFFDAYFSVNVFRSRIDAVYMGLHSGFPTKLSTADVDEGLGHNQTSYSPCFGAVFPSEKPIDFDHTSGRLAHLAPHPLLHRGLGFGDRAFDQPAGRAGDPHRVA